MSTIYLLYSVGTYKIILLEWSKPNNVVWHHNLKYDYLIKRINRLMYIRLKYVNFLFIQNMQENVC